MTNSRGWSKEREREYEGLVDSFEEEGRYEGREEEVAARIVNKQRTEYGETPEARQADKEGKSPDRSLPIEEYDTLTIEEIEPQLENLSEPELKQVRKYELNHKDRKGLLEQIERRLHS